MQKIFHNFVGSILFILFTFATFQANAQTITMNFPQATAYVNSIPVRWTISPSTQTLSEITITFTGTAGAAVGTTTILAIKSANIAATGTFTLNPLDLNNASNVFTVQSGTAIPDGTYSVRMRYVRSDLVAIQSASVSMSIDATTLSPVLTSPVMSTTYGSLISINYQLPETPRLSGYPVQLTFTGAVNTTPVVLNMSSATSVSFQLDTMNVASNSVYVRNIASGGSTLPDDTYSVVLTYVDNSGHSAASTTVTDVLIDTVAPTLALVTAVPSIGHNSNPSFTFNSSEAGTVSVSSGCSTASTTATSGNNTITLSSNTSGAALSEGDYSTCTLRVTDSAGNQSSFLSIPAFTIDTTSPIVTLVGSSYLGAVIGDTYVDAGATATDSHDGSLTASLSSVTTGNTTTIGSVFTVTWSVTDAAGNTGSAVRTILNIAATVTPLPTAINTIAPTPTSIVSPTATPVATLTIVPVPSAIPTAMASPTSTGIPSNPGEITGYIFNSNGQPVTGVVIYLYSVAQDNQTIAHSTVSDIGKLSTITDKDGKYTFANLPKGEYLVKPNLTDVTFEPASSVSSSGGISPSFIAVQRTVNDEGCSRVDQRETILKSDFRAKRLTNFGYTLAKRYRIVAVHTLDGTERMKFENLMNKYSAAIDKLFTAVLQASETLPKIQRECQATSSCSLVKLSVNVNRYNKYLNKISDNALLVLNNAQTKLPHVSLQQLRDYKKHNSLLLRRVAKYSLKLPRRTFECQS